MDRIDWRPPKVGDKVKTDFIREEAHVVRTVTEVYHKKEKMRNGTMGYRYGSTYGVKLDKGEICACCGRFLGGQVPPYGNEPEFIDAHWIKEYCAPDAATVVPPITIPNGN